MSKTGCTALVPTNVSEVQSLARLMSQSLLVPQALRGKEADVCVTIMAGMELGIPPMAALRMIHVVQGKPVMAADLIVACAQRSQVCSYFRCLESTDKIATYETCRKGDKPVKRSFSAEDAKRAGLLSKDNWKKYPAAMLRARCKADLARDVYPDMVAGVYSLDEAQDIDPGFSEPEPAVDAEFTSTEVIEPEVIDESPIDDLLNDMSKAATMAELDALIPRCRDLEGEERDRALAVYRAQKRIIQEATNE